jgi:hypothetical protein
MSLNPGFNLTEALNLVALSAIVEGGDAPPQPVGWSMAFDSPVIGPFTEKWQLRRNDAGAYAVVLRGTAMTAGKHCRGSHLVSCSCGRSLDGRPCPNRLQVRRQYGRERPFRIWARHASPSQGSAKRNPRSAGR